MVFTVWYMDKEQTADGDRARKVTLIQQQLFQIDLS